MYREASFPEIILNIQSSPASGRPDTSGFPHTSISTARTALEQRSQPYPAHTTVAETVLPIADAASIKMTDKSRRKASITITPMSTAKQVREELCRATGQQVWSDNQYWSYYLVMELAKSPAYPPRMLRDHHNKANV